jgi:hypothetical protein
MVESIVKNCHKVLLVGEGNFSYALARTRQHCGMKDFSKKKLKNVSIGSKLHLVATSFDSHEEVLKKYPESLQILKKLNKMGQVDPQNVLEV